MTDTPHLPERYVGREISSGTLNPRDLVPTYIATLSEVWITHPLVQEYNALGEALQLIGDFTLDPAEDIANLLGFWECERMGYFMESLFDALNLIAPEGTYFSASEGDGASFGFWTLEEDESDA